MKCNFKWIPLKLSKRTEITVQISLHPPKKPEIQVWIRLQRPKKPKLEVPTPPQPRKELEFRVILPLLTWFLATWAFPPALQIQYLRNLNISKLHDAPLFV